MLLEQIKKDQMIARKQKDKVATALLTTLLGECTPSAGIYPDVQAVITRFVKNAKVALNALSDEDKRKYNLQYEITILESYLPKKATDEQIQQVVEYVHKLCPTPNPNMGYYIKGVKSELAAYTLDMAKCQEIIKNFLTSRK